MDVNRHNDADRTPPPSDGSESPSKPSSSLLYPSATVKSNGNTGMDPTQPSSHGSMSSSEQHNSPPASQAPIQSNETEPQGTIANDLNSSQQPRAPKKSGMFDRLWSRFSCVSRRRTE